MGCVCTRETININGIKYTVKERLGEGLVVFDVSQQQLFACFCVSRGFSSVDLVECSSSRKKYALKRIICHSADDQKLAVREIDYYKKFKHPNIIELVDSTFKGSKLFFNINSAYVSAKISGSADIVVNATSEALLVLPFYNMGTLHDYLGLRALRKQFLEAKEVLRIFTEICGAVEYMHGFKPDPIAHRDLKTSNVCLTDDLSPVIMDLGSAAPAKVQICGAQDAQKLQDVAAERCSMSYRAPELFNVESYCVIDERTDIWVDIVKFV